MLVRFDDDNYIIPYRTNTIPSTSFAQKPKNLRSIRLIFWRAVRKSQEIVQHEERVVVCQATLSISCYRTLRYIYITRELEAMEVLLCCGLPALALTNPFPGIFAFLLAPWHACGACMCCPIPI